MYLAYLLILVILYYFELQYWKFFKFYNEKHTSFVPV